GEARMRRGGVRLPKQARYQAALRPAPPKCRAPAARITSAAVVDAPLNVPERSEDPAAHRRPALGYALVLAAIAVWSVNATVAKIVVDSGGMSALRLAEVRGTGSAILLFAGVAIFAPPTLRVTRRELGYLAIFGICGLAFVHFFYFTAITHLDIGIALVIQYLAPVLVALSARFFVHEPVRRRLWYALALAFAGLTLVAEIWSGGGTLDGVGVAAALAGAFAYALYILMAEHSVRGWRDVYSLLAWGFLFAALFWAVVPPRWSLRESVLAREASLLGRLEDDSLPVWLLIGYIVVLGTVLPFTRLIPGLRHIAAQRDD